MKKILRIILIAIAILTAVVLARFAVLGHGSKSGQAPGVVSGTLVPCPDKPNCVSSEFGEAAAHAIAPLDYSGAPAERAWGDILQIIEELGGEVAVSNAGWMHHKIESRFAPPPAWDTVIWASIAREWQR